MAKLVLSRDGALVDQWFLDDARVTVGGASDNRVVVSDPAVGERHAAIVAVGNDYILEALGGTGVPVNGKARIRHILQHNDVIELGEFHLRYVDSKASSEIDLERTMLIPGLAPGAGLLAGAVPDKGEITQDLHIPSSRATRTRFPRGRIKWLQGGRGGEGKMLDRVIATFGAPGEAVAVSTRRPHGFYVTHVEGEKHPRVNGESIGREPRHLMSGDIVEVGGERIEFELLES
ncbi:MAG: FHA domain-containing protein [Burkholderiales bacterium]|nr:FHA domain-containing protein [Burkholderiales bacterium]